MSTRRWFDIVQHCDVDDVYDVNIIWGTSFWQNEESISYSIAMCNYGNDVNKLIEVNE